MNLDTIYTGIGMGAGMSYLIFQFCTLQEIKSWRKYLDTGLFILMMFMFFKVGSGYMAAVTTWAGITVSLVLRTATAFVGHGKSDASSKGSEFWTNIQ